MKDLKFLERHYNFREILDILERFWMLKETLDDLKRQNFKVFGFLKSLGLLKVRMFVIVMSILT